MLALAPAHLPVQTKHARCTAHLASTAPAPPARFEMRRGLGGAGGRSPPRGGIDPGRDNQQFVVGEMDSEEGEKSSFLFSC